MEDKTMKKTYSKPEMQVITIQQQGCLLQASKGGYNRTDIKSFGLPIKRTMYDSTSMDLMTKKTSKHSYIYRQMKKMIKNVATRGVLTLVLMMAPFGMMWGQEVNKKFSVTTQMFLNEQKALQKQQKAVDRRHTPAKVRKKAERLIASPDTIGGMAYISCFIHLANPADLSAVRELGVQVQSTFDDMDFITANVPVDKLEALAEVDNVTEIKVARQMRPTTDMARQTTYVNDLLTLSDNALARGITTKYDGKGVVLGIIDIGIDFQHIAFKDKDGNSRIKRAYVYDGDSARICTAPEQIAALTTDDNTQDHGTHTSSTAGGSSVIIEKMDSANFTITVTDDHSKATFGGMAPGADLYLAGISGLLETHLMNAFKDMVHFADSVGKPLVISNSWGTSAGPRNGTGVLADFVAKYFGDSHPNHIILFASSNDAGHAKGSEGGGLFVKKSSASSESPLGTIIHTEKEGGNNYTSVIAYATATEKSSRLNCKLYVLDNATGEVLDSWTITKDTVSFSGMDAYYEGTIDVSIGRNKGIYEIFVDTSDDMKSKVKDAYSLAIEVFPESGSVDINMWAGYYSYFTNLLMTPDHLWVDGTDDMCVSNEATISDAISVGAYVTKTDITNYLGKNYNYNIIGKWGDIAYFSSYATAEMSTTGQAYPWITAPGAQLVAGGNHFHTTEVDDNSYYGEDSGSNMVVNDVNNLYVSMQGTSMATPTAAGIVAQWLQAANEAGKTLTVNQVKDIMRRTANNDYYTIAGPNASHFGQGKIDARAGIQYIINGTIDLYNESYNSAKVSSNAGDSINVMLSDRTLYKDGDWNTLCLPFDLKLEGSLLAGAIARTLTDATLTDSVVTLTFGKPVTTLTAGTPYIIRWDKAADYDSIPGNYDIVNPVFKGVVIDGSDEAFARNTVSLADGNVLFIGSYDAIEFDSLDTNIYYMTVGNALAHMGDKEIQSAFRAFFQFGESSTGTYVFVTNFGEETGVKEVIEVKEVKDDSWYTLDGCKLDKQPTQKGMYINNGRKMVVK